MSERAFLVPGSLSQPRRFVISTADSSDEIQATGEWIACATADTVGVDP